MIQGTENRLVLLICSLWRVDLMDNQPFENDEIFVVPFSFEDVPPVSLNFEELEERHLAYQLYMAGY